MRYLREIIHLSLPIFMANLALMGGAVVDTIWLGRYSSLGLAAMSVSFAIYASIYGLCLGLLRGARQLLAQAHGSKSHINLLHNMQQSILFLFLMGLLAAIITAWCATHLYFFGVSLNMIPIAREYLLVLACGLPLQLFYRFFHMLAQVTNQAYRVVQFNIAGLIIRSLLSGSLIYGIAGLPELGAVGAAYALVLNTCLLLPIFLYYTPSIANCSIWKILLPFNRPDFKAIRSILHIGVPSAMSTFADLLSSSAAITVIAGIGLVASASHQIVSNLNGLLYLLHVALSSACGILVSHKIGENDQATAKKIAWLGIQLNTFLALLIMLSILLLRHDIAMLYTSDAIIQSAVVPLLVIVCIYHFSDAQSTIIGELLCCWKSTILASAIHIVVFCIGSLFLGWYLAKFGWHWGFYIEPMGVSGFWIMVTITSFIAVALNSFLLYSVFKQA